LKLEVLAKLESGLQVVRIHDLLSAEVCDRYIENGLQHPAVNAEVLGRGDTYDPSFRVADMRLLGNDKYPEMQGRVECLTGWLPEDQEMFSLLKYPENGFVKLHTDSHTSLPRNRVGTLIAYLNDDFEGGNTVFEKMNGLRVKPKKGDGLFFNYDPSAPKKGRMLHASDNVTKGNKWILTSWLQWRGEGLIPSISDQKLKDFAL